jgi:predicted nucleic acid-binding Zn ribbon protein
LATREAPGTGSPEPPEGEHCASCGAPAERGQLVCLECGARIALTYRRPPSWKVPVAIIVAVLALFAAGAVLAVAALSDDATNEVDSAPPRPAKASSSPVAATQPNDIVKQGTLYTWPRDLAGFTVILSSAADRSSATAFAESASRSGLARIGVIHSDDFGTLAKGSYVVFAGRYPDRVTADRAKARLSARFSGANTQPVKR